MDFCEDCVAEVDKINIFLKKLVLIIKRIEMFDISKKIKPLDNWFITAIEVFCTFYR